MILMVQSSAITALHGTAVRRAVALSYMRSEHLPTPSWKYGLWTSILTVTRS